MAQRKIDTIKGCGDWWLQSGAARQAAEAMCGETGVRGAWARCAQAAHGQARRRVRSLAYMTSNRGSALTWDCETARLKSRDMDDPFLKDFGQRLWLRLHLRDPPSTDGLGIVNVLTTEQHRQ